MGYSQSDSLEIKKIKGKEYYVHLVEKGQSLYAISKSYDTPIDIIKKENPGVADGLSIGEKIFIPLKRVSNTEPSMDGNYINHTVEKKQTLYSISKLYDVQQNEIMVANPELELGLKEGQIIKIPLKQIKTIEPEAKQNSNYFTHTVSKGETLYSLSKQYNTPVDSIKLVNDGLPQGLRLGETIYIPIKKKPIKERIQLLDSIRKPIIMNIDSIMVEKKAVYTIGLMLPFYLDENAEMTEKRNALEEKRIYPRSKFAIEFYKGLLSALDELSTDSCKFKVYAYDTKGNDTLRTKALLTKPEFKTFDLIIGPLYYDNFTLVADFAKQNKIPLVTPVKQSNRVLLGNPYIFKVIPSKTSIIKPIVELVADSFKTENLLVIEHEKSKEKALADLYVNAYAKTLTANPDDTLIYPSIKKLTITSNFDAVISQLKANQKNVLFVPSSDQSFVTSFFSYVITTLNKRGYEKYNITLIGLGEWSKFENIDLSYFQRLNVHYCSAQFIDSKDSLTDDFINSYVESFSTYPSSNTLLGYDIGEFFGNNFLQTGSLFSEAILSPYNGKSITFHFTKTGIESGFENKNTNLLRFYDYSLERLR